MFWLAIVGMCLAGIIGILAGYNAGHNDGYQRGYYDAGRDYNLW